MHTTKVKQKGASVNSAGELRIEPPIINEMTEATARAAAIAAAEKFRDRYHQVYETDTIALRVFRLFGEDYRWEDQPTSYSVAIDAFMQAMARPEVSQVVMGRMSPSMYEDFLKMLDGMKSFLLLFEESKGIMAELDMVLFEEYRPSGKSTAEWYMNHARKWEKQLRIFNIKHPAK